MILSSNAKYKQVTGVSTLAIAPQVQSHHPPSPTTMTDDLMCVGRQCLYVTWKYIYKCTC